MRTTIINTHRAEPWCLLALLLLVGPLAAQTAPDNEAMALLKAVDTLMYPNAKTLASLNFDDGKGGKESYQMVYYSKESNQKILVRFTAPPDSVGNDILMLERNVWVFNLASKRTIRVASNQSFGSTDFSYGDVLRLNLTENYQPRILQRQPGLVSLELLAKERSAPYYRIVMEIDPAGPWPKRCIMYASSGAEIKQMVYSTIKNVGAGKKPTVLVVRTTLEPDKSNTLTILREAPQDWPDSIFNKRNLEARLEEGK